MVGIVGYITKKDCNLRNLSKLITLMEKEISYTNVELCDRWTNRYYAISRVHHGIVNPDPQPIFNKEESLCIVMDGEVFDYQFEKQRLLKQGHCFYLKENDAEYCLHLYEEDGPKAFAKLNGSFLIALYNPKSHELVLANDRFSSHPLFYYYDNDNKQLLFGSQLRSLLKFDKLPYRLDLQALFEFFTFQRVLAERTFLQDVKVLPPASILRFQDGAISIEQYWKMRYMVEPRSEEYYVRELVKRLQKAVARKTRGNHRLGILLSGGLDSRTVLASMDKIPIAYTLGDFRNTEVQIAQKIAKIKGCKHVFLKRDPDYYFRLVEKAIDIGDGMYRFSHAHFLGFLSRIKEESDILLHGHGLDYTFHGLYLPRAHILKIALPVSDKISLGTLPTAIVQKLKYSVKKEHPEKLFQQEIATQYEESIMGSINSILENQSIYASNVYNAWDYFILHSLFKHYTFLNVACIRAYMEERTIIYDNELFDLYLSMPPHLRVTGNVYKKAFKKLAPELAAIPDANTRVKVDAPLLWEWESTTVRKILRTLKILPIHRSHHPSYRDESWPNFRELIRYNKKLRKLISETIHDEECISSKLFNVKYIDSIFNKHLSGEKNFTYLLLLLLTFGRWHKKYCKRLATSED